MNHALVQPFANLHSRHCIEGQRSGYPNAFCTCISDQFIEIKNGHYGLHTENAQQIFVRRITDKAGAGTWSFVAFDMRYPFGRIVKHDYTNVEAAVIASLDACNEIEALWRGGE